MPSALKKHARSLERTTIFLVKVLLFFCLFLSFFALFSRDNPQIITPSRTAAITMTTFCILGIAMTAVYGGFAVGKKKSKDIISSLMIATFITDFVTYFQLCIMKTTAYGKDILTWQSIGVFFIVLLVQFAVIYIFTYLGNFLYFKINPPEKCILICDDTAAATSVLCKIGKYKKQYRVTDVIRYDDEDINRLIRKSDSVFFYNVPNSYKCDLIEYAYKHQTNIYTSLEIFDVVVSNAKFQTIDDLPMLFSSNKGLSLEQRAIKRTLDILISLVGIILTSPFLLIIAVSIKLYDKGPVFFKQKRATLNGKLFDVLKFRSMIVDADKDGIRPATDNDDRITPVGKIIRKLRVDELPQLINILKGDMSVVGPRPERIEHIEKYTSEIPEFKYRLRTKAGLTGLGQIAGKYNTTPKDKLILDLMYIEKYSIWQDVLIIFRTLKIFFKSDSTEGFDLEEQEK